MPKGYQAKMSLSQYKSRVLNNRHMYENDKKKYEHPGRGKYPRAISTYHIDTYKINTGKHQNTYIAFGYKGLKDERSRIRGIERGGYKVKVENTSRGYKLKS